MPRQFVCECGTTVPLPVSAGQTECRCPGCGVTYYLPPELYTPARRPLPPPGPSGPFGPQPFNLYGQISEHGSARPWRLPRVGTIALGLALLTLGLFLLPLMLFVGVLTLGRSWLLARLIAFGMKTTLLGVMGYRHDGS